MNFSLISLLHVRADQNKFTQLKAEFTLEVMTGLETISKCLFFFHYSVYHNAIVSHTFTQVKMNIKLY